MRRGNERFTGNLQVMNIRIKQDWGRGLAPDNPHHINNRSINVDLLPCLICMYVCIVTTNHGTGLSMNCKYEPYQHIKHEASWCCCSSAAKQVVLNVHVLPKPHIKVCLTLPPPLDLISQGSSHVHAIDLAWHVRCYLQASVYKSCTLSSIDGVLIVHTVYIFWLGLR